VSAPERGDQARASVLVKVEPREAFRIFTEEIDAWWRGGLAYRLGRDRSVVHLEPKLGGRLFETFHTASGQQIEQTGSITAWQPPALFVLEWRAVNFAPDEQTEVEVRFEPAPSGTLVTVTHRGWKRIRADHPVRHGQDSPAFIGTMAGWWGSLLSALRERAERD
jgi:uncharacterized protein YndB with AHSA1/START domain